MLHFIHMIALWAEELQVSSRFLKHITEVVPNQFVLLPGDGAVNPSPTGFAAHHTVCAVLLF